MGHQGSRRKKWLQLPFDPQTGSVVINNIEELQEYKEGMGREWEKL